LAEGVDFVRIDREGAGHAPGLGAGWRDSLLQGIRRARASAATRAASSSERNSPRFVIFWLTVTDACQRLVSLFQLTPRYCEDFGLPSHTRRRQFWLFSAVVTTRMFTRRQSRPSPDRWSTWRSGVRRSARINRCSSAICLAPEVSRDFRSA
jgi:hypothetical protein